MSLLRPRSGRRSRELTAHRLELVHRQPLALAQAGQRASPECLSAGPTSDPPTPAIRCSTYM